jgi:predicted enzyme related to lactoylglutathione lyase
MMMGIKRITFGFATGTLLAVLAFVGGCARFGGATEKGEELPPISVQPTGERHEGKMVWHDLLTSDPATAKTFYGKLFGWSFVQREPRYTEILFDGKKIGGILRIDPDVDRQAAAQWLCFMSVPNVAQAAQKVEKSGGVVVNGPKGFGKRGRGVLVDDAQNAQLFLLDSASGDPIDEEPRVGTWLWNEVWTLDLERELNFYKPLGNYAKAESNGEYAVLLGEGQWRMGVRKIKQKEFAGRWLPVVRVEDPAALLGKVEALGGRVWTYPESGQNTALISDGDGAFLILQQWSFPEGEMEVQP